MSAHVRSLLGRSAKKRGAEGEVAHVDPLVARVHQRPGLVQRLMALREEAVGDAVRERLAEPARVGEGRQHGRHGLGARVALADPVADRVHQRRLHGDRLPTTSSMNSSSTPSSSPRARARARIVALAAHPGRHAAVHLQLGAARDHVDLLGREHARRHRGHAQRRLDHPRQARLDLPDVLDGGRGVGGVLAERLAAARAARR